MQHINILGEQNYVIILIDTENHLTEAYFVLRLKKKTSLGNTMEFPQPGRMHPHTAPL